MSKYDEDRIKYERWAMYILVASIGYILGTVQGKSSEENYRAEIYNLLPKPCQLEIEKANDMKNDLEELKHSPSDYR